MGFEKLTRLAVPLTFELFEYSDLTAKWFQVLLIELKASISKVIEDILNGVKGTYIL